MSNPRDAKVGAVGASSVSIGRFTYGYEKMSIKQWGEGASLKIGSFCSLAENLTILLGGNHRVDWATTFPFGHIFQDDLGGEEIYGHPVSNGDVVIGNDVWVGRNTTIMSGVNVGDGAVIAANSTIVKNIGVYEIWGGNPARFIRSRFDDEIIQKLLSLKWWDWEIASIRKVAPLLSQNPSIEILQKISKFSSQRE
jgi:acetyltransferase-like isoleucine patch superfamily enzyme